MSKHKELNSIPQQGRDGGRERWRERGRNGRKERKKRTEREKKESMVKERKGLLGSPGAPRVR